MKKLLALVLIPFVALAVEPIPYTLMQGYSTKRVNINLAAGAASWTNTYQHLAVVGVSYIGAQSASGSATNATYVVTTGAPATPTPSWSVTTQTVSGVTVTGTGNTATGFGLATNPISSFYADVWTFSGVGTNGGVVLIEGYAP